MIITMVNIMKMNTKKNYKAGLLNLPFSFLFLFYKKEL